MWQYRQTDELYPHYNIDNTDELYHYGRLGMRWGQHIFGDSYKYKSLGQIRLSRKLKSIRKKMGTNSSEYKKIKNKYKKVKKRDTKKYVKFLEDQKNNKNSKNDKSDNKIKKESNTNVRKIKSISELTDNELTKQINRLTNENKYYDLIEANKSYKNENKNITSKVLNKIGKKILEPALTESSKTVVQDLLTQLGKTTNNEINRYYRETLKSVNKRK